MAVDEQFLLAGNVAVGQPAPDFTLQNENQESVTLSELQGSPVVLVFYPFDWSGGCTEELCAIRDDYSSFEQYGAKVYGISRDSVYSHAAWKKSMNYTHSLLADLDGTVARQYGAWNEEKHRADRATVVVDPAGIVRYMVHNHAGKLRDHREAVAALGEISKAVK